MATGFLQHLVFQLLSRITIKVQDILNVAIKQVDALGKLFSPNLEMYCNSFS